MSVSTRQCFLYLMVSRKFSLAVREVTFSKDVNNCVCRVSSLCNNIDCSLSSSKLWILCKCNKLDYYNSTTNQLVTPCISFTFIGLKVSPKICSSGMKKVGNPVFSAMDKIFIIVCLCSTLL